MCSHSKNLVQTWFWRKELEFENEIFVSLNPKNHLQLQLSISFHTKPFTNTYKENYKKWYFDQRLTSVNNWLFVNFDQSQPPIFLSLNPELHCSWVFMLHHLIKSSIQAYFHYKKALFCIWPFPWNVHDAHVLKSRFNAKSALQCIININQ